MSNVLLKKEYPKEYTSAVSTRVSNALLVGEVIGQVIISLTCDYMSRKTAIIFTTAMIVIGGILATAAHGVTINGMFWMMTIARGIIGFGTGGEYPASSTSASEAANELSLKRRGPTFIMVTNFPLSFGSPFAVCVFLIVLSACRRMSSVAFQHRLASMLWNWLHLAPERVLLSNPHAEFSSVSERSYS
ncbi:hypothetical protein DTO217A2_6971 [Paecilomyces variotii]|nr:hypothetical protein DTO217A2_6971 [Paecilomyces variotii]